MITIAIPTLNEEKHIGELLRSLRWQRLAEEMEIVIADAGSSDRTLAVIESYRRSLPGISVVRGGTPPVGRNAAARAARGDPILFVDADVILPRPDFLAETVAHFRGKGLAIAATPVVPRSGKRVDQYIFTFYNAYMRASQLFSPHGIMCIMASRGAFERSGGYPEDVTFGEDCDFVARCARIGRYGILPIPVTFPVRRLEKEGRIKFSLKHIAAEGHRALLGPIRGTIPYDFTYTNKQDSE